MKTTKADLQQVLGEIFDLDGVTLTLASTLHDVPNWDSLNHLSVVVAMEEHYGAVFSTNEITSMISIGALVELLRAHGVEVDWPS